MTSMRKIETNRRNARASTGPKSEVGKARAAMNARRHGLSITALSDPTWARDIQSLARNIAGAGAGIEHQELARLAAAAQIDVMRVRRARLDLIRQALADESSGKSTELNEALFKRLAEGSGTSNPAEITELIGELAGADKLATIFLDLSVKLVQLDRYERRALSRRKFAIRHFENAQSRG